MNNLYKIAGIGLAAAALAAFLAARVIAADGELHIPEYYETGNSSVAVYTDIGNTVSEAANDFAMINGSEPQTRMVNGNEYTYRTLDTGGEMLVNLKCDPDKINYLTVQLWGGDTGDTILWVCDPVSGNMSADDSHPAYRNSIVDRRDWVELNYTSATPQYDGGFIYTTYEIPQIYTSGKESVCLKIYSTGGPSNYGENPVKDQTEPSRGIYAAFVTQDAAFDPADFGIFDGEGDNKADNLYSVSDAEAMETQRDALKAAVQNGIAQIRSWQIYGDDSVPAYMNGMITRADWRRNRPNGEEDWKNAYYTSGRMLAQNMTPLDMLELAAYAYNHADALELAEEEQAEMLDRVVQGIDFLCRAQGSNGGFYSADNTWIGGPDRRAASGNNLTGFGLRAAGKAILDVYDALDDDILNEEIDSDADGIADTARKTAWINMLTAVRDYLITLDGGYGHAPNQDMANSIAALRFDTALGKLGGSQLRRAERTSVFAICFGDENNLVTSCKWVSPKGTILENFGAVQGGYSGDYGANAIVEMSQLAELGSEYYSVNYRKYLTKVYNTLDYYYFEGKKLVDGEFVPQEYTEGIISNRNAYYPGTERYPIDIYSALTLGNDTALKIIANYLEQQDIASKLADGGELTPSNVHFEDNVLDAAYLYESFDEIIVAAIERDIDSYEFAMEDNTKLSFAWADEMARNVVIKDNGERIYMALNWRNPAYSTTIYNTVYEKDRQSIRANNLCRVHATGTEFDRYGYAAMTTDGYSDWTNISDTDGYMQALMTCEYGSYTVIMNSRSDKNYTAAELDGTAELDHSVKYKDLISGTIYEYSGGYWHSSGEIMSLGASSTLVLKALDITASEPVIKDGKATTVIENNTDDAVQVTLYAANYGDNDELDDLDMKTITAQPGRTTIILDAPSAEKAYIWDENQKPIER